MEENVKNCDFDFCSPKEYYRRIIEEAPYIPAETNDTVSLQDIPWLNPQLVKEGVEFTNNHRMAIFAAITSATLFGLSFKSITGILLRHGDISDPEFAFRRHLSGVERVLTWADENILSNDEKSSKGLRNFTFVRKTHALVVKNLKMGNKIPNLKAETENKERFEFIKALRDDLEFVDMDPPMHLLTWDPEVPLSQFNMVATQFATIGPIFLRRENLGFDQKGINGYLHIMALSGRMLGTLDRFNLGLHASHEYCQLFYTNMILASIKHTDETVVILQEAFVRGMFGNSTTITLKALTYHALRAAEPNFEGNHLNKLLSVKEKFGTGALGAIQWCLLNAPFGKTLGNSLTKYYFESSYQKYVKT